MTVHPVPSIHGIYASRNGMIFSERSGTMRLRPPFVHRNGYLAVGVGEGARVKTRYVHTLVLEAFRGERPTPSAQTRHLNGRKWDNRASNLRWGTSAENARDRVRHARQRCRLPQQIRRCPPNMVQYPPMPTHAMSYAQRTARTHSRPAAARRGYSADWQSLREQFLTEHPVCNRCGRVAVLVHHVRSVADRPDLRLDRNNLESLCRECHAAAHSKNETKLAARQV